MKDFIESLRAKPDYVRRRIALGASAGVTAAVTLLWTVAQMSSGAFALGTTPKDSELTTTLTNRAEGTASAFSAAAAFFSGTPSSGIEVVGTESSSTLDDAPPEERTVIPF